MAVFLVTFLSVQKSDNEEKSMAISCLTGIAIPFVYFVWHNGFLRRPYQPKYVVGEDADHRREE